MSLIQRIKSRRLEEVINEGAKVSITGSVGVVTDSVVLPVPADRALILTGFNLSTAAVSPFFVSFGFKLGSGATYVVFQTYIGGGSPSIDRVYQLGDWYRSDLNYNLVITSTGNTTYSFDLRVVSEPAALGYIEHEGSDGHSKRATLPDESGKARGQE